MTKKRPFRKHSILWAGKGTPPHSEGLSYDLFEDPVLEDRS